MAQGPSLIFDKSSLESLNLDEAVLMDNFYLSTITPLFFVECLADLEKEIRSKSTPEQVVGSLADRTPESQSYPNVHHMTILKAELSRQFDLRTVYGRVMLAGGEPVQLGDKKGFVFRQSPEAEALSRWTKREFLDIERNIAKDWRRSLNRVDFDAMVKSVMAQLGRWRKAGTDAVEHSGRHHDQGPARSRDSGGATRLRAPPIRSSGAHSSSRPAARWQMVHRRSRWKAWSRPNDSDADVGEGGNRCMDVRGRGR
jgi:hypothetical protein